jgi:tRNA-specific 2-thiouridylase
MAADLTKDQSYFLFPVPPSALARTWFPLGDLDKPTVREHARRFGLLTADKPESMDTCFVPEGDHGAVVDAMRPDLDLSGEIVDESGAVLGRHDGYHRYTIGQRHGLRVALGFPAYVVRIDAETAQVVVAGGERLLHHGLHARDAVWQEAVAPGQPALARIRHRGGLTPCRLYPTAAGEVRAAFDVPARAVTPGQAAVFYDGDRVLGGATIVGPWQPDVVADLGGVPA